MEFVLFSESLVDLGVAWLSDFSPDLFHSPVDGQLLPLPAEGGVVDRTWQPCGPTGLDLNRDTSTYLGRDIPTFCSHCKMRMLHPKFSRKAVVQLS